MNLRYAVAAALAAGGFAATPVVAQNAYSKIEPSFYELDKNNDGNIDQKEAQARPWLSQGFSRFDTDHNGKLGKDEFLAARQANHAARGNAPSASAPAPSVAGGTRPTEDVFENLDRNNDGAIDATEMQARPWLQRNLSQYDTNPKDGKLNKLEFNAALNAQRAAHAAGTNAAATPTAPAAPSAAGATRRPAEDVFENIDKNHDGVIDTTEAQARPWLRESFSQFDADVNGKLGKDEFNAALANHRK